MPKKGSNKPQTPSDITSIKIDKETALKRLLARSQWLEARRVAVVKTQEDCTLALAVALLNLKEILDCSWEDIAALHLGCCDGSTLHKLVNRNLSIRGKFYDRLTLCINYFRQSRNLPVVKFPLWLED